MPTIEQLIAEPSDKVTVIASGAYPADVDQLVRNPRFQRLILEVPLDHEFPADVDGWSFSRMLQEQTRQRGIPYQFIGSPVQAARIFIGAMRQAFDPEATTEQIRNAARVLGAI